MNRFNYSDNLPALNAKLVRLQESNADPERITALQAEVKFWTEHITYRQRKEGRQESTSKSQEKAPYCPNIIYYTKKP